MKDLDLQGEGTSDFDSYQIFISGNLTKSGSGQQTLRWATGGETEDVGPAQTYEVGGAVTVNAGILQFGNGYRTNSFIVGGNLDVKSSAAFRLLEDARPAHWR